VTIVIFGGNGDLAHRKLLPALYNLHVDGLLPPRIAIAGVGRKDTPDAAYREFAKDGITKFSRRPIDEQAWQTFAAMLFFVKASLDGEQVLAPLGATSSSTSAASPATASTTSRCRRRCSFPR